MSDSIYIKEWRKAARMSQEELAHRLEVTTATVSRMETGVHNVSTSRLADIAEALGVQITDLYRKPGEAEPAVRPQHKIVPEAAVPAPLPPPAAMPIDLPVMGTCAGSLGEGAMQFEGGVVDMVRRPPALLGAAGVYGLYVQGDSMAPLYRDGDLVIAHPHRKPHNGDCIIIALQHGEHEPEQAYIKELVRTTATEIITRQYNPPTEISFPRSTAKYWHKVLRTADLLGL